MDEASLTNGKSFPGLAKRVEAHLSLGELFGHLQRGMGGAVAFVFESEGR